MPDIDQKNGIDMANIASINGQDVASGGAFNPVAGTGTYTEIVPSTGLIKRGGQSHSAVNPITSGRQSSQDNAPGYIKPAG